MCRQQCRAGLSQFILNLVQGQALIWVEGNVLTVDYREADSRAVSKALHIQQVTLLRRRLHCLGWNLSFFTPQPPGVLRVLSRNTTSVKPPATRLLANNTTPSFTMNAYDGGTNSVG